jgi:tetratricopeptide (TPR) repeat protein
LFLAATRRHFAELTMRLRFFACALLFAVSLHAGATPVGINAAGQVHIDRGRSLFAQGQAQQAFDAYREAAKADPASSLPDSYTASMFGHLASRNSGEPAEKYHQQSLAFARRALKHNDADPLANEIIRLAGQDAAPPLHLPSREAMRLIDAGETLFHQKRYNEALLQYEQAAQSDPLYSTAEVFAGDCYFAEQHWSEAEVRFRKAAEIEPLNGQAWRFLSDALAQQGKKREAQDALLSGIAADPSQRPNWDKLDTMLRKDGAVMAWLRLLHKPKVTLDPKTGAPNVEIAKELAAKPDSADMGFWLTYGIAIANGMAQKDRTTSPFAAEVEALREALKVDAELQEKVPRAFDDPSLTLLRQLGARGQLEPAVLLLMYRESYRPQLEAWKQAHPNGVREFVLIQNVRP